MISIADLVRYRRQKEKLVRRVAEARIPTQYGDFTCYAYDDLLDGETHLAFVKGAPSGEENVLVRVHSECLTGDVFGSLRCDCGPQLDAAMAPHLRGGHGRRSSTSAATRDAASASPTRCSPTSCRKRATTRSRPTSALGHPADRREYGTGNQILVDLGITTMRIMTNNPAKIAGITQVAHGLAGFGLEITEVVPLEIAPNPENIEYLRTKRDRMGHLLDGLEGRRTPMATDAISPTASRRCSKGAGLRIAVVCGRFNDQITFRLLDGVRRGLTSAGVADDAVTVGVGTGRARTAIGRAGPRQARRLRRSDRARVRDPRRDHALRVGG